jgi:hypothetical protein
VVFAKDWIHRLKIAAPHLIVGLVGNKTDRVARAVPTEKIELFSAHEDVAFAETSAKTGDNVRTIWQELGRRLLNQPEQGGYETALCRGDMGNPVASSLTLDANNTIWTSYNECKFRQKKIAINAQQGAPDWPPFTLETTTANEFRTELWGTKYLRKQRHYFDIKSGVYPGVNAISLQRSH